MSHHTHHIQPAANNGHGQEQSRREEAAMAPYRRGELDRPGGWEPIARLREEFDRLFDQFYHGWLGMKGGPWEGWGMDVQETDESVVVRAEAPGFEPGDFDVQVRGDQLVLKAAHQTESAEQEKEKEKDDARREWRRHDLRRSVTLPADIDADRVKASYRNGVLTITLPKAEGSKAHRINVEA